MTKQVWKDFQVWWKEVTGMEVIIDYESIILGVNPQDPDLVLNLCILIVKRMIYGSRFGHYNANITCFKQLLKFNFDLEKERAIKNNTIFKHNDKWSLFNMHDI